LEDTIGAQIRKKRKEHFLTLEKLGEMLGLSHTYIAKIEKGLTTPSFKQIAMLANILEMDENYIILAYNKIPPKTMETIIKNPFIIDLLEDSDLITRARTLYNERIRSSTSDTI